MPSTFFRSKSLDKYLQEVGEIWLFTGRFFREAFRPPFEWRELLQQCYFIGVQSLFLGGEHATVGLQAGTGLRAADVQRRRLIGDVEEGKGLLSQLLYDTTLFASLDTSISQVDTLIARQVQPLFEELQYSATEIRAASTTLHSIVEQLDEGQGLAAALLRDTAMVGKLEQTLYNVEEGTARFNENMEAMRRHFLFRGYFKKLEKEEQKQKKD